jgi:hypothetical protein
MTYSRMITLIRVVFLALVATVASVGLLCAGDFEDFVGKFTLPMEVRWGENTLPPGDYTFAINPQVTPYTAKVTGNNRTFFVMAVSSDDRFSGQSSLLLTRRGQTGVIRELHLAIPGLKPSYSQQDVRDYDRGKQVSNNGTRTSNTGGIALIYSRPKGEPPMVAQTPLLFQRIPILMASK